MACVERHDPLQLYPKSENSYSKRSKLKLHVSHRGGQKNPVPNNLVGEKTTNLGRARHN